MAAFRPSRSLGLLAATMAAAWAGGLALLTASNQTPGLPAEVPWPLLFAAVLGTPALIGGLGAVSGSRTLLVAAGVLCLAQSILAFSGVTLVLLVPGFVFLRAAVTPMAARAADEPVHLLRWVVLVALALPVAVLVALNVGVLGTVGFVALTAVVAALAGRGRVSIRPRDALIGIGVVGLVVGAVYAALTNSQTICWNARSTPTGLVYERIPAQPEGPVQLNGDVVSSGCAGGQPTIEGTALTLILLVGAIAISAETARTAGTSHT